MTRASAVVFASVLVACIGCDHAAKRLAESALQGSQAVSFAADLVRFELAFNPGAFLSLGADLPDGLRHFLLIGLVPFVLVLACGAVLRSREASRQQLVGLGLLVGGGLGNWLDRLLHDGSVTDFVSVGLGGLRTGVFNFADVAVICGVGLLLFELRRPALPPPEPREPADAQP